jgi:hypothetical protein
MKPTKKFVTTSVANTRIGRFLAASIDKFNNTHTLEDIYKAKLFTNHPQPQPNSLLLNLPVELRIHIYEYVFAPSDEPLTVRPRALHNDSSTTLTLLATCRLVHGEAYREAFETVHFNLRGENGLVFYKKIWSLGTLQQHLRFINVNMRIEDLEPSTGNNPFVLTQLPLRELKIHLGEVGDVLVWEDEIGLYYRLISAVLFWTTPQNVLDDTTHPWHQANLLSKAVRELSVATWRYAPRKEELYNMMIRNQAETVKVSMGARGTEVLWHTFTHFELVSKSYTHLNVRCATSGKTKKLWLVFADESGTTYFHFGSKLELADVEMQKGSKLGSDDVEIWEILDN